MNYSIVVFLIGLGSIWAAPAATEIEHELGVFERIVEEHKDLLPPELVEAYQGLTENEKNILKEVFHKERSAHEGDFIRALKEKSPELGARAEHLRDIIQKKLDALPEKPRRFMTNMIESGRFLHRRNLSGEKIKPATVRVFIDTEYDSYKALSDESKAELRKVFPGVVKFLEDETIKEEISKVIGQL